MARSQKTSNPMVRESLERSLLEAIADGDREALADMYRTYQPRLFKFVYRLTRSYTAAEELVNDIMLAVWRNAAGYRGDSKPSTWIFGIAYRQSLKRLSRKKLAVAGDLEAADLPDDQPSSLEQEDWVRNGLAALPTAQRLAVELVFFLGLSYEEVAVVAGCPVNTVKTRMFHARRKLKEHLESSATGTVPQGGIS